MDRIDEAWLDRQLRYEIPGGYRFDGCRVGGSWVVIKVVYPDGSAHAVRIQRDLFELPSYLHEIPNYLAPSPRYDVDRLNRKVTNLLGDPVLPLLVRSYREMFTAIADTLRREGVTALDAVSGDTEEETERNRFLLRLEPFRYLLADLASGRAEEATRRWAAEALRSWDRIAPVDPGLRPETLLDNPLIAWGGVAMSGFFTRSELPRAAAAALEHLEAADPAQAAAFLDQTVLMVEAVTLIVGRSLGFRLFCDATEAFPWRFASDEERDAPDQFIHLNLR